MKLFVITLLIIISVAELILIIYLHFRNKKILIAKITTPCGQCLKEAAYQRLQSRNIILKSAYIICNQIPSVLYSSHRSRIIAKETCQKFYYCLKDNLEKI